MSVERQRHRVPSASTRPAFWEVEEEHAHRGTKIRWFVTVIVTVITTLTAATLGAGQTVPASPTWSSTTAWSST